jgi:hypothetical protein
MSSRIASRSSKSVGLCKYHLSPCIPPHEEYANSAKSPVSLFALVQLLFFGLACKSRSTETEKKNDPDGAKTLEKIGSCVNGKKRMWTLN